jgi:hypothetical protein
MSLQILPFTVYTSPGFAMQIMPIYLAYATIIIAAVA